VREMRDLPRIVAATEVGKKVDVLILRNGAEQSLGVTLGRLEQGERIIEEARINELAPDSDPENTEDSVSDLLQSLPALVGFDAAMLNEDVAANYEIASDAHGVVITEIVRGSDAEDKGLAPGMVVEEVNQQKVSDLGQLIDMVSGAREAGRAAVLFKVADAAGNRRFVAVRLN
jgi:serine protease Do